MESYLDPDSSGIILQDTFLQMFFPEEVCEDIFKGRVVNTNILSCNHGFGGGERRRDWRGGGRKACHNPIECCVPARTKAW